WAFNIINNLKFCQLSTSAEVFKNIGSELSAVVIGSGPSLQYDVHLINQLKSKCLLIAAGSSIQALEYHGIYPHLVVSIDGGIPNYRVFQNINTSQVPLLFASQIHSDILNN